MLEAVSASAGCRNVLVVTGSAAEEVTEFIILSAKSVCSLMPDFDSTFGNNTLIQCVAGARQGVSTTSAPRWWNDQVATEGTASRMLGGSAVPTAWKASGHAGHRRAQDEMLAVLLDLDLL